MSSNNDSNGNCNNGNCNNGSSDSSSNCGSNNGWSTAFHAFAFTVGTVVASATVRSNATAAFGWTVASALATHQCFQRLSASTSEAESLPFACTAGFTFFMTYAGITILCRAADATVQGGR